MPGWSNGMPIVSDPPGVAPGTGAGAGFGPSPPEPQAARAMTVTPASAAAASRRTVLAISVPSAGRRGRVEVVRVDARSVCRPVVRPDRLEPIVGIRDDGGSHQPPAEPEHQGEDGDPENDDQEADLMA